MRMENIIIQILILLVLVISISCVIFHFIMKFLKKRNAKNNIYNKLSLIGPTKINRKNLYDFELGYNKTRYLIKVIYNYNNYEITVNGKNDWLLNDKDVRSKKEGTKLTKIYDLVNEEIENVQKIYVIYPSSRVLMMSINESELAFIYPTLNCYGVNLVIFDELEKAIKK